MSSIVKVVNVSGSVIHITNINVVLQKNGSLILSESETMRNPEIMGSVNAKLLEIQSMEKEKTEEPEVEEVNVEEVDTEVEAEEVAKEESEETEEQVYFSDADKNAEPVSESSYVKSKDGVFEIHPETTEPVEQKDEKESPRTEIVDGIEIINPVKEVTKKINGVEIVVNGDEGADEYDPAFIDNN